MVLHIKLRGHLRWNGLHFVVPLDQMCLGNVLRQRFTVYHATLLPRPTGERLVFLSGESHVCTVLLEHLSVFMQYYSDYTLSVLDKAFCQITRMWRHTQTSSIVWWVLLVAFHHHIYLKLVQWAFIYTLFWKNMYLNAIPQWLYTLCILNIVCVPIWLCPRLNINHFHLSHLRLIFMLFLV